MLSIRSFTAAAAVAGLLAAGAALASPAQAADTPSRTAVSFLDVTNGSFETPPAAPPWSPFVVGQTFGGWTVTSGNVDLVGNYWQAADGTQSVDLNGTVPGAISQTFATVPGTAYVVTFSLAGNPDYPQAPTLRTGNVLVDGTPRSSFAFNVTGKSRTNMGWVTKTVGFTATDTSTTLTFASTTLGVKGPAIDKVSVVPGCSCAL